MAEGKFFFVRSFLNGLVLSVQHGKTFPGTPVVTWPQKPEANDDQLFYEDVATGTVRTKLNDFCIDVQGDTLVINPYQPDCSTQEWMVAGNKVHSRSDPSWVIDIAGKCDEPGSRVCAWDYNGGDHQMWNIEYSAPRYFHIRSMMNGKVVDIRGADPNPGARVIMYEQNASHDDNQLWYEDRYGNIRSKLNDFAMDASDGGMVMKPFDASNPHQQWYMNGNRIISRMNPSHVVDIRGASSSNGAKLIPYEYKGGDNQHWVQDYTN